jgi:hypothetical protein
MRDWRKPTVEQIDWHLLQGALNKQAALVVRSNRAFCELLRAKGLDQVADLIESGKYPKRGTPLLDAVAQTKREIVPVMRRQEAFQRRRNGDKLRKGQRLRLLDSIMTKMAENGDLDHISDKQRELIRGKVIKTLEREAVKK